MFTNRVLGRNEFAESDFDATPYKFNDELGEFTATIDCKRWGKNRKLVTYMTFADGRKVAGLTWNNADYMGLANLPIGARIRVTYELSKRGNPRIVKVTTMPKEELFREEG